MNDRHIRDADLVVVGAGLAGLAAARVAAAEGSQVVVVEARDRVGGRVLNEDRADTGPRGGAGHGAGGGHLPHP